MDEPEPDGRRRTVSGGPLDGKPFAVYGYEVWLAWEQVREDRPIADKRTAAAPLPLSSRTCVRCWEV